jgi:hypothetical protein
LRSRQSLSPAFAGCRDNRPSYLFVDQYDRWSKLRGETIIHLAREKEGSQVLHIHIACPDDLRDKLRAVCDVPVSETRAEDETRMNFMSGIKNFLPIPASLI